MKMKVDEKPIKTEHLMHRPKRALSAYNFFFKEEREKILRLTSPPSSKPRRSHGKIGFADLARTVAEKWKTLDQETLRIYEIKAAEDKSRYEREIEACNRDRLKCKDESSTRISQVNADLFGSYHDMHLYKPTLNSPMEVTDSSSCESDDIPVYDDRNHGYCLFDTKCKDGSLSYSLGDFEPINIQVFWSFEAWASSFDDESLNVIRYLIK
jgi:hypothetical protein